jgi:hypothetical protein
VAADKDRNAIRAEIENLKRDLRLGEQRKVDLLQKLEELAQDIKLKGEVPSRIFFGFQRDDTVHVFYPSCSQS